MSINIEFHDSSKDIKDDQIRVEIHDAKGILVKHDGRECVVKQFKSHLSDKMYDASEIRALSGPEREEVFKEIKAYFEPAAMKAALARASETIKESKITVNPQLERAHVQIAETPSEEFSKKITDPEWETMRNTLLKANTVYQKVNHVTFQLNPVVASVELNLVAPDAESEKNITDKELGNADQKIQNSEVGNLFKSCKEIQKNIHEYLKERSSLGRNDKTGNFDQLVVTNDNPAAIAWQNITLHKLREMWKGFQDEKAKLASLGDPELFKTQWEELNANEAQLKKEMDNATKMESWETEVVAATGLLRRGKLSIDAKDLPRMQAVHNKLQFRHDILGDIFKPSIRDDLEVMIPKEELESRVLTEAELKSYNDQLIEKEKARQKILDEQEKIESGALSEPTVIPTVPAEIKEAVAATIQKPQMSTITKTGKLVDSIRELVQSSAFEWMNPKDKSKDLDQILEQLNRFQTLYSSATVKEKTEIDLQKNKIIKMLKEVIVLSPEEEITKKYLLELKPESKKGTWFFQRDKTQPDNPDLCDVVIKKAYIQQLLTVDGVGDYAKLRDTINLIFKNEYMDPLDVKLNRLSSM